MRKEITTPVTEDIADGDMDVVRANTLLIAMEAYMEQLKASTTALRQYLTDRTAPNETVKSLLGESTHRRGGESKPKVSDIAMYGSWLYDNGEEDMTDSGYILPIDEALDPKAIAAIMKKHNVSEIPGITWTSARADSMALRKPSWAELLADDVMRTETAEALGMTGIPQIEQPTNDDNEEEYSWDRI